MPRNEHTRQVRERERSRRNVATGANVLRMRRRLAAKAGLTLEVYTAFASVRKEIAAQRKLAQHIIDTFISEDAYTRYEQRAKRRDCSTEEQNAAKNEYARIYTGNRYRTNPAVRAQMIGNARRRNARLRGATYVDDVSLEAIAERDGDRCHICKKRVLEKDRTLDHLVPVSKGGEHTSTNVALAHRSCNSKRGAGRLDAQLLLHG